MTRPSGYALKERRPVAIDDTEVDARAREWRDAARREGLRSMIAIPLLTPHAPTGTVNLYRTSAGSWEPRQVRLLEFSASALATLESVMRFARRRGWIVADPVERSSTTSARGPSVAASACSAEPSSSVLEPRTATPGATVLEIR
jgi:hypothetical protein